MALLAPDDQQRLRDEFAGMTRRVHLVFFTQALGSDTCLVTRQILDELPPLSDRIVIDEVNFVLEPERAREYGIDRVPAIAVTYEEPSGDTAPAPLRDTRMRFVGAPAGYEFVSLVEAILLVGGRATYLSPESQARVAAVDRPTTMHVFTTPTCPLCPRAVGVAHEMAYLNPHITAYAVEVTEPSHWLVAGIDTFEATDELYLNEYPDRGALVPLLHTVYQGTANGFAESDWTQSDPQHLVMYLRPLGEGGVLYNTLGHCRGHYDMVPVKDYWPTIDRCSWELPVFYELLRRSLRWARGQTA